jgi:hypothetical protein
MNDPLDRILRDHAATAIADDGFSARVMQALPVRHADARAWLKPALVLGSMTLGSVLAIVLSPATGSLLEGFSELAQLRVFTPAAMTAMAVSCALLVSAVIFAGDTD